MNRKYVLGIALLAASLAGAGCSGMSEGNARPDNAAGRPPVAVDAVHAATADLVEGIDVVGTLAPKFQAEVKSEVSGTVTEVYVNEWVRVKRGTPLARVDSRETEALREKAQAAVAMARAGLLEAEAAGNRAEREHQRALKLKDVGLVTQQNLDDALTLKEAAAARIAAAKAQIRAAEEDVRHATTRVSKAVIRSPFDGTVAERLVNVGEVVGEMQKVVFRLVDNRLLDLTVTVPSTEMAAVRVGQPVDFSTDAVPGKTFTGRVKFINPAVNEGDRSVKVVAEVPNVPETLKGGLYVKGRIVTGKRGGVLQVPRTALLTWDVAGKKADIFVAGDGVARRRTVGTGRVSGDLVEIGSGLAKGELVITRGGFNLKDGDRVTLSQPKGDK